MTRSGILILLLILTGNTSFFSQSFGSHKVTPLTKDFKVKDFDEEAYRKELDYKYSSKIINRKSRTNFIDILVEDKKSCLNIPDYDNWIEATEYVSKIAHKVLPESYFFGRKVSILRSADVNAYCFEDGSIYITIGMLALLSDEAELAAVLAHEYGHMIHDDAYKHYQTMLNANNAYILPMGKKQVSAESISKELMQHESDADAMAFERFNYCSYSLNSAITLFTKFKMLEDFGKKSKDYKAPRGKYIRTHPLATERIAHMKKLVGQMEPTATHRFLVDSALFFKIRASATDEVIYLNFCTKDYYNCVYNSYKEFVKDPSDQFYAFFVLEGLRRLMMVDNSIENKYFITSEYRTSEKNSLLDLLGSDKKQKEKPKMIHSMYKNTYEESIFYNYSEIYPFQKDIIDVKNKYTTNDTIEFTTYKEAYVHFYNTLKEKCKACHYSLVLSDSIPEIVPGNFVMDNTQEAILYNELKTSKIYDPSLYSSSKFPIFLNDVSVYEGTVQFNQLRVSVASYVREMFETKLSSTPTSFDNFFYQKLRYNEINQLKNDLDQNVDYYFKAREKKDKKKNRSVLNKYTVEYDHKRSNPDQLQLATDHKFNKLVWVNIYSETKATIRTTSKDANTYFNGAKMTYNAIEEKVTYSATVYCLDLKNNTLSALATDDYKKVKLTGVFVNKISLSEFQNDNVEIFNKLFDDIITISEKLIKN